MIQARSPRSTLGGLMLAQKDAECRIERNRGNFLRKTVEAFFADIAYECALAKTTFRRIS
jgi:hypothetical protein